MPLRDTSGLGQHTARELVHADFEVAFNLVEIAESESNRALAAQLLQKARVMLEEIRSRLDRITSQDREAFESRCEELAGAIERASWPDFQVSGGSET